MIYSMTAFARMEDQTPLGNLICELRSVNHRYLEISVHLPESLRVIEMAVRERIRQSINRGKVDCKIAYHANLRHDAFAINFELAKQLCVASEQISDFLNNAAPVHPSDILRFNGVIEMKEMDLNMMQPHLNQLLNSTINELLIVRNREGEALKQVIAQRIAKMLEQLQLVQQRLPDLLATQKERLEKRFAEVKLDLDSQRLEQEMIIFTNKIDVSEEIDRANTHITEINRVIASGGLVGRRLDFLLQELNREANTLGSKSVDAIVTHAAVELKVLTEQIREQIQNLE